MNNIVRYINELIDQHDYVIIPGFGGFITSYAAARLFPFEGTALPPSKSIAFNSSLTTNDGLLVNHIAAAEDIPVKSASEQVGQFASHCKTTLQNNDILMLPGIGRIFVDVEDHVQFVQDQSQNHLLSAYGLPEVPAKAVLRERSFATPEAPVQLIPKKKSHRWAVAMVAIFLLLVASASFLLVQDFRASTFSIFSHLTNDTTLAKYVPATVEANSPIFGILALNLSLPSETIKEEENEAASGKTHSGTMRTAEEETHRINESSIPQGYFIVIGSFKRQKSISEVEKDLTQAGQQSFTIPGPNGFTRVGIFISGEFVDAVYKLDSMRHVYGKNAWILRNR